MGERLPYKQRVSGSSPLTSTIFLFINAGYHPALFLLIFRIMQVVIPMKYVSMLFYLAGSFCLIGFAISSQDGWLYAGIACIALGFIIAKVFPARKNPDPKA